MNRIDSKNQRTNKTEKNYSRKKGRKLRKWVPGVLILLAGLGLYTLLAQVVNAINIDKYASEEGHIDDAAQTYYVNNEQGPEVISGHDALRMDDVAKGIIDEVINGANPHAKIASNYYEADKQIIPMDELFRSLRSQLYGRENDYPDTLKILDESSFENYLEHNNQTIDSYDKIYDDILKMASKGDESALIDYLESLGFTNSSGGRL